MSDNLVSGLVVPKSCVRCERSWQEGPDLVCRRFPPVPSIHMVPAPPPRVGQVMPQVFTAFPVVSPSLWCGEFALDPAKARMGLT